MSVEITDTTHMISKPPSIPNCVTAQPLTYGSCTVYEKCTCPRSPDAVSHDENTRFIIPIPADTWSVYCDMDNDSSKDTDSTMIQPLPAASWTVYEDNKLSDTVITYDTPLDRGLLDATLDELDELFLQTDSTYTVSERDDEHPEDEEVKRQLTISHCIMKLISSYF